MMRRMTLALGAMATIAASATAEPAITGISIVGDTPTLVFDHLRDQVQPYNIPDAAVGAWREANGTIDLMIPSFENYRMRGPDLHSLRMDPHEVFSSEADGQYIPEQDFNYSSWLVSPYTLDGHTIFALTHMEWYGCLLNGECTNPATGTDYTLPSWVTTLTDMVSTDGGASFAPDGAGPAHVISNQFGFRWAGSEALKRKLYVTAVNHGNYDQTGLVAHTRVIREGNFYYALGDIIVRDFIHANYRTGEAPVLATGFVELRTPDITKPHGWQIWVAGSHWIPLNQAKVTATTVNFGLFTTTPNPTLGQIAYDQKSGLYILITPDFSTNGLFYATTASLAAPQWTQGQLITRSDSSPHALIYDPRADTNNPTATPPCTTYARGFQPANYPSLLDAGSPGMNFEFLNGQPELFYVVNPALYPAPCTGNNLGRDLYRIALRIAYGPKP